jgi:hypothetical protein
MAINTTMVQCRKCKHATLMQWFKNPIIAQCAIHGDRQVAESNRICKEFVESFNEAPITHYDSYEK